MLSVKARAKVNLTLRVTGKRADGYHLLQSLVCFPDLGDSLEISPADELILAQEGPFAEAMGPLEENLVYRAAEALRSQAGVESGAALCLTKNLPVAAGIGGGSADAAAALNGLMTLWEIDEATVDLPALGLALGADVPVCLASEPTLVSGIGEELMPLGFLPALGILLVNPRQALSTAAVFKAHWDDFSHPEGWLDLPHENEAFIARLAVSSNDLEAAACRVLPLVDEVLARLWALPECRLARMSGSGATCFGLFPTVADAKAAATALAETMPQWWVAAAPLSESGA